MDEAELFIERFACHGSVQEGHANARVFEHQLHQAAVKAAPGSSGDTITRPFERTEAHA